MLTFNLSGYFVEYTLEHCHETGVLSQSCSNERCSFIFKVLFCNKEQQLMTASNSFFSPSCKSSITLKALKIGHSVETEKRFLLQLHLFPTCRDERVKSAEAKASAKPATCRTALMFGVLQLVLLIETLINTKSIDVLGFCSYYKCSQSFNPLFID